MFNIDHWAEIGQSLNKQKMRTLLTAFGVSWGIFMLTFLLGMGKGLEHGTMATYQDTMVNSVWISSAKTSMPYKGIPPGRKITLSIDDITSLERLSEIALIAPSKWSESTTTMHYQGSTGSFQVYGISATNAEIQKLSLVNGRQINVLDEQNSSNVAIVGSRIIEVLMQNQKNPIGQSIILGNTSFKIIGVYKKSLGEQVSNRVYIPYTTLMKTFDPSPSINLISLTVSSGYVWQDIKPKIFRILSQRHQFDFNDNSALNSYDISEDVRKLESLLNGIRTLMIIVGAGTLIAGCIGVSNMMLISVKERTREFGIRKAIGATPSNILFMVLNETLIITFLAGVAGLFASLGVIKLIRIVDIKSDFFSNPQVDIKISLLALGVLIISGLIAGYLPARQAVRISPIEALRHE